MKKYPLPIEIVRGRIPIVTQEFGETKNVAWYKANGVNVDSHNGTDIVISGGSVATYGTKLVNPFPKALVNKVWFESPLTTKGNGVKIQFTDERGKISTVVWHCSECNYQEEYLERDTLGFIGNSGLVTPAPTFAAVHNGAHLHLMSYVNDVLVDPREIFDFTKWYVSETDTGVVKDLPPIQHFLNIISGKIGSMFKS